MAIQKHSFPRAPFRVWLLALLVALGAALLHGLGSRAAPARSTPPALATRVDEEARRAAERTVPPARLAGADAMLQREIERGAFPGAALAVGVSAQELQRVGLGRVGWTEAAEVADPDSTLYDLASLTKVVATTTAVMLLVEDGKMRLDDPVTRYLPEFGGGRGGGITIRQLLTHTAGLRAGFDPRGDTPAQVRERLIELPPVLEPGSDVLYSDVGFVVLWAAAQRAAGEPLTRLLQRRVYGPLGMRSTVFGPAVGCPRCAPTLVLEGGEPYRGGSYDLTGRRLEGRGGNAGLFSTAHDLGRFAAMLTSGGELDGVRVLRPETIDTFFRPQPGAGTRTLGWEVYCREGIVRDSDGCRRVYGIGHTGATGTSLWIEPRRRIWVVLLTNRVYEPKVKIRMEEFRRQLFEEIIGGAEPSLALR